MGHQAVGDDGRVGSLGGDAVANLESARQGPVTDDDMLLDAEITKPFDQFDEVFDGAVCSRFQIDMANFHLSPMCRISCLFP